MATLSQSRTDVCVYTDVIRLSTLFVTKSSCNIMFLVKKKKNVAFGMEVAVKKLDWVNFTAKKVINLIIID